MRSINSSVFVLLAFLIIGILPAVFSVSALFLSADLSWGKLGNVVILSGVSIPLLSVMTWISILRNDFESTTDKLAAGVMLISFICTIMMTYPSLTVMLA
jgi:hypothetical protein